jgi:thiol-disulfide isomerase/thioredoxin
VRPGSPARTVVLASLLASLACAGRRDIEVFDLEGRVVRPLASSSERVTVFLFVATDCPISNRYAPTVRRLHEEFGEKGVRFWLVYADPAEKAEAIRRHVEDYGYGIAALRDPRHALAKLADARVTPEAAVFVHTETGPSLVYRGRIDDWYVDFGRSRAAPTTRDLADALEAALAGRPVASPTTRAVGCFIPGRE